MMEMINIAEPQLGIEEKERVLEVLNSKMLASGEYVKQFEKEFAAYHNMQHAVATSSGTTALHAMINALPVEPGDKVFTTPFSFVASANALLYCGLVPVFVDIDPKTYNISSAALAEAIKEHPDAKAVLVVHIFGLPADMDEIAALASENNLLLLEDCAQSHGAVYKGEKVGTFGTAAAFSFYPTKNITSGEGGMVLTNNQQLAEQVRRFINHGQSCRYHHDFLGYNFRMTNIHAAIGIEQLKKLDKFNCKRIANANYYLNNIDNSKVLLPYTPPSCTHVYHQFTIQVEEREKFISYMQNKQIGCAVHYPLLIPNQKLYAEYQRDRLSWPTAEALCKHCVSIPVHPGLSEQQLQYIAEAVNSYV